MFSQFSFAVLTSENVGGVIIRYPDSNKIYVCKDGTLYRLGEAYEQGFLTIEQIQRIADIHHSFHPYLPDKCTSSELQWAFIEYMKETENLDIIINNIYVLKYIGTYNDNLVVKFKVVGSVLPTPVYRDEFGSDVVLEYPDGNRIYVYKDGKINTLPEAYEKQLISLDDIKMIKEQQVWVVRYN